MVKQTLAELSDEIIHSDFATDAGRCTHQMLQGVMLGAVSTGSPELVQQIKSHSELIDFFDKNSKTEVPIAGLIRGRFVSRRIDRLRIDTAAKTIKILDYKTDVNPTTFRDKYILQIHEYVALMREIYPDYSISGYILWLHNWELEKIV